MARVLKITSGLMGVLLLLMVGAMGAGRDFPENSEWIILEASGSDRSYLRKVSPDGKETTIAELSPDFFPEFHRGYWVYGWGGYQFRRVNLLTGEVQKVLEHTTYYTEFTWSPNGQLIYYSVHYGPLFRIRPDGSPRQQLSPQGIVSNRFFGTSFAFLDDGSVLLNGSDSTESLPHMLRLNSDGTLRYGLEADLPELFYAPPHRDWVVVVDSRVWEYPLRWVSIDGGERHPLLALADIPFSTESRMSMAGKDLLLLQTDFGLIAFYRDATEPLWRIPHASLESIASDGQVALVSTGHFMSLIDVVTGKPIWMVSGMMEWIWSPDQQAVYYIVTRHNGDYELRRLGRAASGYTKLLDSPKMMRLIDWTADGEWLMVQVYDKRIHVKADGSQIQDKGFWWNRAFVGWWPNHSWDWSALPLVAVAVMFIFVPPLISRIRLQQRGRV